MLKKLTVIMLALIILAMPVISFASPEIIGTNATTSADYLMEIKNPASASSATSTQTYLVSAVALENTVITLYSYSADTGMYHKMYTNGAPVESVVGASGLFAKQITLGKGSNKLLVHATRADNEYKNSFLEITLLGEGFLSKIKTFAQNLFN